MRQDPAFLDRVDIKQHIPHLSDRAIYEIYKECLEEMSRREIIEGVTFDVIQVDPQDPQTALQYVEQPAKSLLLPSFDEMILNYQIFPDAVPKLLADAVTASVVRGCGHDVELARTDGSRVLAVAPFDDCLHYLSSCIVTAPEAIFERPSRPSRRVSRRKIRPRRRRSKGTHTLPGGRELIQLHMLWGNCTTHGWELTPTRVI